MKESVLLKKKKSSTSKEYLDAVVYIYVVSYCDVV